MVEAPEASAVPKYVLTVQRLLDAKLEQVWRCWTEPELLEKWFCPRPWFLTDARIDLRTGGEFSAVFNGPEGEKFNSVGVYLEIEHQRMLKSTDAFLPGWIPSERAFMVSEARFEEASGGCTEFTYRAMHWNESALKEHEQMQFHAGWRKVVDQLEDIARSLD